MNALQTFFFPFLVRHCDLVQQKKKKNLKKKKDKI